MIVPFIDLKAHNDMLNHKLQDAAGEVLHSCDFILGQQVRFFEREFAQFCGSKFGVGLNSGTDALFLALLSLGIGAGDEVICPVYTYIATALCISYTGAKPVFVDIDQRSFNIDPEKIKRKISKKTKAIIAVHLYGNPAPMPEILKIAKEHKLRVIEDAAQAHGARIKDARGNWQSVGTLGDIGCFSFYPTKNLSGCGDAGIALTNSKSIYKKLIILRDQGRAGKNRYAHHIKGYNSRLDSIQAALLRVKLPYLEKWNKARQNLAHLYSKSLEQIPGVIVPYEQPNSQHVFHIYAIRLKKKRADVYNQLRKKNIHASIIYHLPLHLQGAYKELRYKKGDFPGAERVCREILCLPMYPQLTKEKLKFVVESLKELV